ncbi:MAG: hypothetical protein LBF94_01265 [Puniceicoccales bacterium]|jgi:ABC-2 type transport system permease protein|nr:hypothetical protein [Puniceicoccales bacterium]
MKKFCVLFKYEIHKLLVSPSTYFIAAIFTAILALIYVFTLREFIVNDQDFSFAHAFLRHCWIPILLGVPLLSMRTFSEDYKTEMMQSVKTIAIGDFSIVLAKFLATYLFYTALWGSSLLLVFFPTMSVPTLMQSGSFLTTFNLVGGYFYIILSGLMFISMSIFFSSLTENQILSGSLAFIAIFATFLSGPIFSSKILSSGTFMDHAFVRPLNIFHQMDNACLGVFDTRIVVLYITLSLLFLSLTKVSLEKKFS